MAMSVMRLIPAGKLHAPSPPSRAALAHARGKPVL